MAYSSSTKVTFAKAKFYFLEGSVVFYGYRNKNGKDVYDYTIYNDHDVIIGRGETFRRQPANKSYASVLLTEALEKLPSRTHR